MTRQRDNFRDFHVDGAGSAWAIVGRDGTRLAGFISFGAAIDWIVHNNLRPKMHSKMAYHGPRESERRHG